MQPQIELHNIQVSIVRQLFLRGPLRFTQMNIEAVTSDQFSYHVRQLLKQNLIQKEGDAYALTDRGKNWAIKLSSTSNAFIEQALLALRAVITKQENGQLFYLLQKRTKVPFQGMLGAPGGKILFGEDVLQAARRTVSHETGLDCSFELRGLTHFKEKRKDAFVQDKYFFVVSSMIWQGELQPRGETGENVWLSHEQVQTADNLHDGLLDILSIGAHETFQFTEQTFSISQY